MGWYVTCKICGTTEKYGLGCNCYQKETERNLARMKGCLIEDSILSDDGPTQYLLHRLRPAEGPVFYLQICIQDGGGEYTCWRRAVEITKEEFEEAKNPPTVTSLPRESSFDIEEEEANPGKIYITNVPQFCTGLWELLEKYGKVTTTGIFTPNHSVVIACFEDSRDADDAIRELNGKLFNGSHIVVSRTPPN